MFLFTLTMARQVSGWMALFDGVVLCIMGFNTLFYLVLAWYDPTEDPVFHDPS